MSPSFWVPCFVSNILLFVPSALSKIFKHVLCFIIRQLLFLASAHAAIVQSLHFSDLLFFSVTSPDFSVFLHTTFFSILAFPQFFCRTLLVWNMCHLLQLPSWSTGWEGWTMGRLRSRVSVQDQLPISGSLLPACESRNLCLLPHSMGYSLKVLLDSSSHFNIGLFGLLVICFS